MFNRNEAARWAEANHLADALRTLDPETRGVRDVGERDARIGWRDQRSPVRLTLTLNAEPIRAATPSALRHRALCECWQCWSN